MKIYFLIISFLSIVLFFLNCEKNEIEFADENITIGTQSPGFSIYKTKEDYFEYINVGIDSLGNITSYPVYNKNSINIVDIGNTKYKYTQRWRLKSGYIVDKEIGCNNAFTNVTFSEQINYIESNSCDITSDWYQTRIIDKNPFLSYYYTIGDTIPRLFTLGEINEMIENGTLETVFTKIK